MRVVPRPFFHTADIKPSRALTTILDIVLIADNENELQEMLDTVVRDEKKGLSLNKKKTEVMVIEKLYACMQYRNEWDSFKTSSQITILDLFLGLTIDSQMTWKKHTENISNKCLRVIGTLNRIKHIKRRQAELPTQTRVILYNSLILPHIN